MVDSPYGNDRISPCSDKGASQFGTRPPYNNTSRMPSNSRFSLRNGRPNSRWIWATFFTTLTLLLYVTLRHGSSFLSPISTKGSAYPPQSIWSESPSAQGRLNQSLEAAASLVDLTCPGLTQDLFEEPRLTLEQQKRYAHLKHSPRLSRTEQADSKFMFVALLKDVQHILPDLINTFIVLTTFLGPDKISFSIEEGPSSDCSPSLIEHVLVPTIIEMGVAPSDIAIHTRSQGIDWNNRHRIELLAQLRNGVMSPLWEDQGVSFDGDRVNNTSIDLKPRTVGKNVRAVVFFNDVYMSASHVLELLHQHLYKKVEGNKNAIMTTAVDYRWGGPDSSPVFYDVWVARTVEDGESFKKFPDVDGERDLFPNSPQNLAKYINLLPFPVYCSWNGIAVIDPQVFLPPHNIRFRRSMPYKNECSASECSLLCNDMWKAGLGRIQTIPSVKVAYEQDISYRVKLESDISHRANHWRDGVPPPDNDVYVTEWPEHPPQKVMCAAWPEANGRALWPWNDKHWVDPYVE